MSSINISSVIVGITLGLAGTTSAATFTSANNGDWATATTWSPNGNPDVGGYTAGAVDGLNGTDSVVINGHAITLDATTYGTGNTHFNVSNGNSLTLNGGSLTTGGSGGSLLLGWFDNTDTGTTGTVIVNDGTVTFHNQARVGLGTTGAEIILGDGTGAAGSALLTRSGGGSDNFQTEGPVNLTINSDGHLENFQPIFARAAGTTATVTVNGGRITQNSVEPANSQFSLNVGWAGTALMTINNGSVIDTGIQSLGVGRENGSAGTVVQNGGTVTGRGLVLGRFSGSGGTYLMGGGTLVNNSFLGVAWEGGGTFIQTGGTVVSPSMTLTATGTATGIYTLDGGDLQVNGITHAGTATFNWGNGTLTTRDNLAEGGIDYTNPGGYANGPVVRAGTVLDSSLSLATGFNGGASALDLGILHNNNGVRSNVLRVTGSLDLSGTGDTLSAIGGAYLLRPNTGSAIDYGSIHLVHATGGLTNTFDNFIAPGTDNIGFTEYTGAFSGAANLPVNTWYLEHTADSVYFHYKVEGTVPEPETMGLILLGLALIRGLRA